jgi:hypothetical protein
MVQPIFHCKKGLGRSNLAMVALSADLNACAVAGKVAESVPEVPVV